MTIEELGIPTLEANVNKLANMVPEAGIGKAQRLGTGNLVLVDSNGVQTWEGFKDNLSLPDPLLPGQYFNRTSNRNLISWLYTDDPSADLSGPVLRPSRCCVETQGALFFTWRRHREEFDAQARDHGHEELSLIVNWLENAAVFAQFVSQDTSECLQVRRQASRSGIPGNELKAYKLGCVLKQKTMGGFWWFFGPTGPLRGKNDADPTVNDDPPRKDDLGGPGGRPGG